VLAKVFVERAHFFCGGDEQFFGRLFKARGMGHDVAHGDGLAEGRWNLEIKVIVHIPIEVDLALFDELHHRGPGEGLGDRSRTEEGIGRRNRFSLLYVSEAISLGEEHLPVLDDGDDRACDIFFLQVGRHQAVEEGIHILGRQLVSRRRSDHRGDRCRLSGLTPRSAGLLPPHR
jgi:hypothetical protein